MSSALVKALSVVRDSLAGASPWVGFSGGLDSTVLLHLAWQGGLSPRAVHINHGMHEDAGHWQAHCVATCERWSIPLTVMPVQVEAGGQGWEAAARRARYEAFEAVLGPEQTLLLAQHQDDQVETLLLRALRGAGIDGLAAMPERRALGAGSLWRPLLTLPRSALEAYAVGQELSWIEDGSNADLHFDRNYLRREVLPRIEARWPGYRATLSRSAAQLRQVAASLPEHSLPTLRSATGDPGFALASLPAAAPETARAIRGWLRQHGLQAPPAVRLENFIAQLQGGSGAQLRTSAYLLQRYREGVFAYAPLPTPQSGSWAIASGQTLMIEGVGEISLEGKTDESTPFTVRLRRGGERLRAADGSHRSLKNLFQMHAVPPWWRDRIPLLYAGDELLALAGLARAASPLAAALSLRWHPPQLPEIGESDRPSH